MHINDDELIAAQITRGSWDSVDNETYHNMFANGSQLCEGKALEVEILK